MARSAAFVSDTDKSRTPEDWKLLSRCGRGGRVVECSGLENRRTGNRSVSSNLTHAAVTQNKDVPGGPHPGGPCLFRLPSRLPAAVEAHLGLFQRRQPIMNNRIDFGEERFQFFAGIHDLNYYRQVE